MIIDNLVETIKNYQIKYIILYLIIFIWFIQACGIKTSRLQAQNSPNYPYIAKRLREIKGLHNNISFELRDGYHIVSISFDSCHLYSRINYDSASKKYFVQKKLKGKDVNLWRRMISDNSCENIKDSITLNKWIHDRVNNILNITDSIGILCSTYYSQTAGYNPVRDTITYESRCIENKFWIKDKQELAFILRDSSCISEFTSQEIIYKEREFVWIKADDPSTPYNSCQKTLKSYYGRR